MSVARLAAPSQTPHHRWTTAAILVLIAGMLSSCSTTGITINEGLISKVSISPDGRAIAAAIDGWGTNEDDPTIVRWWNWNGKDGIWHVPGYLVRAFGWAADGSLLVGGQRKSRMPEVPWWRLDSKGKVLAACKGLPKGPGILDRMNDPRYKNQPIYAGKHISRGIASIAELAGGRVVTGGTDQTLAVWEGCSPTWLNSETCCRAEDSITVTARGAGFETSGEGIYQNKNEGYYEDMGPRRWSPSPWKAVSIQAPVVPAGTRLRANGADCMATMDASGHIIVVGEHPWTASIEPDKTDDWNEWVSLAASHDCKIIAVANRHRIVKVTSP